jgi:CubicO group peptidase (beta-lactamase class C family)
MVAFAWRFAVLMLVFCKLTSGPLMAQESPPADAVVAAALQPYVDREELAGAVALVADVKGILSITAVGAADRESGRPMRGDSMFWIASQSKPMTAAAVMLLVDAGKIALDDPIEKYLPEFGGLMVVSEKDEQRVVLRKPERPITIRQVLSHTSGMPFRSALEVPIVFAAMR